MKGNQGLEALAALCGGRQPTTATTNANPATHTATPSAVHSTAAAANEPSSDSAATAGSSTHLLTRQTSERNVDSTSSASENNGIVSMGTQQQRHPTATSQLVASIPGAVATGSNFTPQQISQAILAAATSQSGRLDPVLTQSILYPSGLRGPAGNADPAPPAPVSPAPTAPANTGSVFANTMQQLILQQYVAQANAQQQQAQQRAQAQAVAAAAANGAQSHAALIAMNLAAGKTVQNPHLLPGASADTSTLNAKATGSADSSHLGTGHAIATTSLQQQAQALLQQAQQQVNQIQHPQKIHQQQYQYAAAGANTIPSILQAATASGGRILPAAGQLSTSSEKAGIVDRGNNAMDVDTGIGSKKQQKRAANRRSAQLSRKRKKQFIEELKEENDELRRKEQILRTIPDLIVVFDSSGKLGFVSESVGRFLDMSPEKLEGTSFWDLICQDSVRLLKAAFMDSLAAREADSDMAVLGSGVWELRLKNKDEQYMLVTLNGVVHFKGDAPECVCSIRPLGEYDQQQDEQEHSASSKQQPKSIGSDDKDKADGGTSENKKSMNRAVSCSDGDASRSSDGSNGTQQSVLNGRHAHAHAHGHGRSMSSAAQDEVASDAKKRNKMFRRVMARANDEGDNGGGSDDNNNNVEADGTNNSVRISDGDSSCGLSD